MNKNITHKIPRAALTLLMMLAMSLTASATNFITDVMVAGHSNPSDFSTLIQTLQGQGWTDINQDLNKGCGSSSDYIHLLYKTQTSSGNTGVPITDFCIRTGANPPDNLTHEGRTYYLVPCQGSSSFVNSHGDLNHGASGEYIFLYYTKDALSNNTGVTAITFNTTQSGGVGEVNGNTGYDLNHGAGGDYIYMHLTTASGGNVVTLSSGSGNVALQNGHILTGTGGTETQVTIADGATVTFNGVNNTAIPDNSSHQWPGISCLGNATIVLNGSTTNSVKGGRGGSGIHVAANKTLTIQGSGTLNATGGYRGAGIGSGWGDSCGNITISGGTITANGDDGAAGIGSGWQSSCGNITISGGTITATGGQSAAGIGSGYYNSSCGNITITNGVTRVTATKGQGSNNAVGAGNGGSTCGTVTIGGVQTGNITMSPFVTYPYTVAFDANGGTGTMNNQSFMYNVAQNLTANAFNNAGHPFLGWATTANGNVAYTNGQSVSNLTQTAGATVTLYAKWTNMVTLTSQIGEVLLQDGDTLSGTGGQNTRVKIADGATVTFNGVDLTALNNNSSWPGITCLGDAVIVLNGGTTNSVNGGNQSPGIYIAANKTLTIQGSGTLNATGGYRGAGIGSGLGSSCGNITISGGMVNATGGTSSAGIGSGRDNSSCGNITISGGTVNATGGDHSAGIGSGYYQSSCGNITITNGVTCVTVTKGQYSNNAVGAGNGSTCGTVTIGDVQTGNITMTPFVTYPYTVSFDSNGGTGSMADMNYMYNVARNLIPNSFTYPPYVFEGWATSATGPKVYNDGQSVSNLTQNSGSTVTLFAKWTTDPTHLSVSGNVYTIHTATGWDLFCDLLAENSNGYFTGKTIKLDTDISVTRMAGSSGHEFNGTFDGQGHTLTVSYQNTDNNVRTAPFSYVNGATIQNLVVAGSITGTADRAAGIVGETGSSLSHVTNCVSSVNVSGGQYTAGISIGGNVEITGCVFNGTITGASMSGGFVGCSNSALVISNCLFAPQVGSSLSGGTFYYNGGGDITLVNSYYTTSLGTPQGKQARSIAAGENVTVAFSGQATTYNVSRISAYSTGMVYNNTLYAGEDDMVSLNLSCTPPSGYLFNGFQASAGILTGTENPYSLTMPDANVTIQAVLEVVYYIDGDGGTHYCTDFTVLTGNETMLGAGWYVVASDITYNSTLTLYDDVTIILCNGKTMTVTSASGSGINGRQSNLTLYSQSLDSIAGTLNVTTNDRQYAINLSNYIQHSGNVVVNNSSSDALNASNITINGGSIHATSGVYGIYAGNMTVNGGSVNANGYTCGISVDDNGIITLGWTNESDRIRASSYYGTVTVATGQAFIDEAGQWYLNTLTENQKAAIAGQTLSPFTDFDMSFTITYITNGGTLPDNYPTTYTFAETITLPIPIKEDMEDVFFKGWYDNATFEGDPIFEIAAGTALGDKTFYAHWRLEYTDVTYLDADGQTQTVHARVLYGDETSLDGGCYTLIDDVSCNHTLSFGGNTTLIIPDSLSLYFYRITEGGYYIEGNGITVEGDLAIYGQTGREGYIYISASGAAVYATGDVTVGNVIFDYFFSGYSILSGGDIRITGSQFYAYGTLSGGNIFIAGGQFYLYSTINANNGNGTITLGYLDEDDYIYCDGYEGIIYCDGYEGIVVVREGQTLKDDWYDNTFSGTLTAEEIAYIAGKPLVPYIEPTVTQTVALSVGTNWFSTNLEITLADLQAALRAALPGAANRSIKITSQNSGYSQNLGNNWNGQLRTLDVAQMYMITVPAACEITLEGMPIDPADHPVNIVVGSNWIGFPLQEEMTPNNALAGFGTVGDVIKSQNSGQATKRGNSWMGQLRNLVPGKGYIYNATANGVLTFPVSAK